MKRIKMKAEKTSVEIWNLDGNGFRCAVALNGIVRFVGSAEQCQRHAEILKPDPDRDRQDKMLVRAL
jgi:hypothetical protein